MESTAFGGFEDGERVHKLKNVGEIERLEKGIFSPESLESTQP